MAFLSRQLRALQSTLLRTMSTGQHPKVEGPRMLKEDFSRQRYSCCRALTRRLRRLAGHCTLTPFFSHFDFTVSHCVLDSRMRLAVLFVCFTVIGGGQQPKRGWNVASSQGNGIIGAGALKAQAF